VRTSDVEFSPESSRRDRKDTIVNPTFQRGNQMRSRHREPKNNGPYDLNKTRRTYVWRRKERESWGNALDVRFFGGGEKKNQGFDYLSGMIK